MAIQTIGTDTISSSNANTTSNTASGTSKFMSYLAMGTSVAGPVVEQSLLTSGNSSAAAIAGATANATYSSSVAASGGSPSYTSISNPYTASSTSGSTAYYSGGGSYATTDSSSVESILTDSAASNAYLIGIQAEIQQQATVYNGISNALKAKYDMERNSIQNLK